MSVLAKQSWLRPAVLSAALLATATLAAGVMPRSAAAQYAYDCRYPAAGYYLYTYPAYTYYPVYVYPYYSYPSYGYPYSGLFSSIKQSVGSTACTATSSRMKISRIALSRHIETSRCLVAAM